MNFKFHTLIEESFAVQPNSKIFTFFRDQTEERLQSIVIAITK